jgi:hypothetical protein
MKYPPSKLETLIVPHNLEIVNAALLNHAEDYDGYPRLRWIESLSIMIRRYDVITGIQRYRLDGTVERDERVKLGTIRLTALSDSSTEVVILRHCWGTYSTCDHVNDEGSIEVFMEFFGDFSETMIKRYRAANERTLIGRGFLDEDLDAGERPKRQEPVGSAPGRRGRQPSTQKEWERRSATVEEVLQKREKLGITLEQACARAGVCYSTFRYWRREISKRRGVTENDKKMIEN